MANEFYQPISYPTYQFSQPYDPVRGAIEAYTTGLGIRQQKQQMEAQKQQMQMQKQQAEMQKQQMAMSQQRLDMEQRREIREARRADLEETMKKMEMEPKMELMGISKSYQQIVNQNPDLPLEQRYKMALDAAKSSKFPQTVEAVKKYIMMDMEDKYPNSELRAKAENLVFGTTVTPEQIEARDMEMVKGEWGAAGYSKTGKKVFEVTSDVQKRAEERAQAGLGMEQQRLEIAKTRAAEGPGGGDADSRREVGNAEQALRRIATTKQRLARRELFAKTLIAQGDISGFGDIASESEIAKFLNASGEAKKLQGEMILRNEVEPGYKNVALAEKRWDTNFPTYAKSEAWRMNPDLAPAEPAAPVAPAEPSVPATSPYAAAKTALLAPASAAPVDETARLQAIASSPVDSPERRAARIRLAELAQQSGQFRYAPVTMPSRQQLTPQPIGWGTKY